MTAIKPLTSSARPDEFTTDWRVELSAGDRPAQVAEIGTGDVEPARWGHIQDGKEAIAFALARSVSQTGPSTIDVNGAGQLDFRVASSTSLTVYEHFVTSPVQIGAVTSPTAMLSPLAAVCDPLQYTSSGVGVFVR